MGEPVDGRPRFLVTAQSWAAEPREITWVEAETMLVDLREQGVVVTGDLRVGFAFTPPFPAWCGAVSVSPLGVANHGVSSPDRVAG